MMKITAVEALPDTRLRVTLSTGEALTVDVREYLTAPGYEALCDADVFARASVEEWGHAIEWPGDVAIPIEALYQLSQEQAAPAPTSGALVTG